jgi:hypothetical protein
MLLARLTLNTRNDTANQPAQLAQLDDGNDRAVLAATKLPFLAARPIASLGLPASTCPTGGFSSSKTPKLRKHPDKTLTNYPRISLLG